MMRRDLRDGIRLEILSRQETKRGIDGQCPLELDMNRRHRSWSHPFRRAEWIAVLAMGVLGGIVWSLHVRQSYVDLQSGRQQRRLLILGYCLRTQNCETPCSRCVNVSPEIVADWRLYFETRPFQPISPHFLHHSTPTILQKTQLVAELLNVPPEMQRARCARILQLLRRDDLTAARKQLDNWWQEGRGEQG